MHSEWDLHLFCIQSYIFQWHSKLYSSDINWQTAQLQGTSKVMELTPTGQLSVTSDFLFVMPYDVYSMYLNLCWATRFMVHSCLFIMFIARPVSMYVNFIPVSVSLAGTGRLVLNITGSCGGKSKALQKLKPQKQQYFCVEEFGACILGDYVSKLKLKEFVR